MKNLLLLLSLIFSSFGFSQNELSLASAIEKALMNNYQIKLIKANYDIAQTQNTWGMAGMVPTIAGANYQVPPELYPRVYHARRKY